MDVSKATVTSISAIVNSPQSQSQPPASKNDKQTEKRQDATVVKLSAQAQQMSRAENQNNNTERAETKPQEAAEPLGIRFIEGASKGSSVNTFA